MLEENGEDKRLEKVTNEEGFEVFEIKRLL